MNESVSVSVSVSTQAVMAQTASNHRVRPPRACMLLHCCAALMRRADACAALQLLAGDWHTSTHARYTRLTRHRERHTGKAIVLTHVPHCFCSDAQQQPPSTERDERERDEREDADD